MAGEGLPRRHLSADWKTESGRTTWVSGCSRPGREGRGAGRGLLQEAVEAGERATDGEGGGGGRGVRHRDNGASTLSDRDSPWKRLRRGTAWPTYTLTDHAALHIDRGL